MSSELITSPLTRALDALMKNNKVLVIDGLNGDSRTEVKINPSIQFILFWEGDPEKVPLGFSKKEIFNDTFREKSYMYSGALRFTEEEGEPILYKSIGPMLIPVSRNEG